MDRRTFLRGAGAVPLMGCTTVPAERRHGPGVAITVDDFNLADDVIMSGEARDGRIRKALADYGIAGAGFVAGKYVDADVAPRVLAAWSAGGHILGNHTFSHAYYSGADPSAYMADILKCEGLLTPYAGFRKLFRYPFLAEGKTAQGRDALRALLRVNGYRIGHVTIDASDWVYAARLTRRLKADPTSDLTPYRQAYLDHLWDRASYYDRLAQSVFGHSLNHTLLLHHNLTTGLFLGDVLAMFKAKGWRLVDAATAFKQPEFLSEYKTLPSGQSLVWAAAKASGRYETQLRYPGEDERYEAPKLDALGL
ncbi:polysaccharide deacetylase family protein [Asticcacaulis sp. 201]|uniref:polysaccharide deacetylase family protein n=1 Tax=Asticcacaulis sp. 201 TaxID=3028787 RepID=UPI00291621D8|nr:polysaccharide deacetylase family protein [Asticcacaulis sp. 201]MDV6330081.1 polysaccharide deacetylase family protein [Asticcacaulis sp. 201]